MRGCPVTHTGEERNAVVREIGERVGVPTPHIDTLPGLARLHARVRGLYPSPGAGV